MEDVYEHLDQSEIEAFIGRLPFVREYAIRVASAAPGQVVIELPFDDRFSGPPGQFPASMVGTAGDVAAGAARLAPASPGWGGPDTAIPLPLDCLPHTEKLVTHRHGV